MADDLLKQSLSQIDMAWLLQHTEALWRLELGQTFTAYRAAAQYAEGLLHDAGLARVERIAFPADGKTTYQDMTMPMAWEATRGKLTILRSPITFEDLVVADYGRHPFHLVCGSVNTPPEGQIVRLITEEQLLSGENAHGALVVLNAETRPHDLLPCLLDLGAVGYVSSALTGQYRTPDAISWHNNSTEGSHWHVHDDDRPFIGYSVSPRVGDSLRAVARIGEVLARAESDGRRYAGEIDVVTGVIPGEDPREIWLLAHLYEPLADDNSIGVVGSVAIAKMLRQMIDAGVIPRPRFTLRLVFGAEAYGFTAYAAHRGNTLREQTIGALNFDGVPMQNSGRVVLSPAALPFFGDYLLEDIVIRSRALGLALRFHESGYYGDDTLLTDPTVGLPTLWIICDIELWHNSAQDMSIFDMSATKKYLAIYATWLARMLTLDRETAGPFVKRATDLARKRLRRVAEQLRGDETLGSEEAVQAMAFACRREIGRLTDFLRILPEEAISDALASVERYAKRAMTAVRRTSGEETTPAKPSLPELIATDIFPARTAPGFPHDMHRIPKSERRNLPGQSIYGPLANLLAGMDGRKSLRELMLEVGRERLRAMTPGEMRQYIGAIEYLTEYGYLATRYARTIDKADIVDALNRAGIMRGDLVLVHSSMSPFGYIEGGAETVIDALLEAITDTGTLLMPTFTNSPIYMGGDSLSRRGFRPFNPATSKAWTGRVTNSFLRRPGVMRNAHPTHSVAGIGPLTEACLGDHRETDSPTGHTSPFGKLLEHGGKMLWFGADLASTTFFHFLEDAADLPYLKEAVCMVENLDGSQRPVVVPKHLPGHREFYHYPGEDTKMYRRLLHDGLQIATTPLGYGTLKVIDAQQMYQLGMQALEEDPNLMLCDDPGCRFCSQARTERIYP